MADLARRLNNHNREILLPYPDARNSRAFVLRSNPRLLGQKGDGFTKVRAERAGSGRGPYRGRRRPSRHYSGWARRGRARKTGGTYFQHPGRPGID